MLVNNISNVTQQTSEMSKFWLIDDAGKSSMSATLTIISFVVTTIIYIAAAFEKIGLVTIRPFDAASAAYLAPSLGLYFGRHWTEASSVTINSQRQ